MDEWINFGFWYSAIASKSTREKKLLDSPIFIIILMPALCPSRPEAITRRRAICRVALLDFEENSFVSIKFTDQFHAIPFPAEKHMVCLV